MKEAQSQLQTGDRQFKLAAFFFFLVVFLYIIWRAFSLPVCNDEASSFLIYIRDGRFLPFQPEHIYSANNHFLNSALAWLLLQFFAAGEFVLRLPNVLAFPLYAFFAYQISGLFTAKHLKWLVFLLLLTPHYVVEYFAYARGYGLGMAFLLGAIYFLLESSVRFRAKQLWLGLLCMVLAVAANLGLLISFLLWLPMAIFVLLKNKKVKNAAFLAAAVLLPLLFFVQYSLKLKSVNELYYGQDSLAGTGWSVFSNLLPIGQFAQVYPVLALVLGVLIFAFVRIFNLGLFKIQAVHIVTALFLGNVLAAVVMHYFLDVPYPSGRTALHWVVLLVLLLGVLLHQQKAIFSWIFTSIAVLLLVLFGVKNASLSNFNRATDLFWAKEQLPKSLAKTMLEVDEKQGRKSTITTQNRYHQYVLAFQNEVHAGGNLNLSETFDAEPNFTSDFVVVDLAAFPEFLAFYDTLLYDPHSSISLLKRKINLLQKHIVTQKVRKQNFNDEFTALLERDVKNYQNKTVQIHVNLKTTAQKSAFNGLIFVQMQDAAGQQIFYKQVESFLFPSASKNTKEVSFSFTVAKVPLGAQKMNVYFWNNWRQQILELTSEVGVCEFVEDEDGRF